jgi:hypothetical protein
MCYYAPYITTTSPAALGVLQQIKRAGSLFASSYSKSWSFPRAARLEMLHTITTDESRLLLILRQSKPMQTSCNPVDCALNTDRCSGVPAALLNPAICRYWWVSLRSTLVIVNEVDPTLL